MKRSRILAAGIAATMIVLFAGSNAHADATEGALATASCYACHNAGGSNTPTLVGYPPELIVSQMKAFRDGTRPGTIMNRLAKGYTDEQIEAMGRYWSSN